MSPVLFPAIMVGSSALVGAVSVVASKRGIAATARVEASERDIAARHTADVWTGRRVADRCDVPLACAQACAELMHAQAACHRTADDYPTLTWANSACARLGHAPSTVVARLAIGFDVETPRLAVVSCLFAALSRVRTSLYTTGRTVEGTTVITVIGIIRNHVLPMVDGHEHLIPLLDADDAEFHAEFRASSALLSMGGAR